MVSGRNGAEPPEAARGDRPQGGSRAENVVPSTSAAEI